MTQKDYDTRSIGPRIRMMMPLLTPLEAKVVEMVFALKDFNITTSLKDIAQNANVSEAMVVKITKKLGFSGYRDFRLAINQYLNEPTSALKQELSLDDSNYDIVQKVFRKSINTLEETLSILKMEAFSKAADYFCNAKQRDFYGVGGSAQVARDISHKFLRIGIRTTVFDDTHMMMMSASLLQKDDVAIGFSHSGTTSAITEALSLAKENGAKTIAITNYDQSPLAKLADVVLCSTSQGSPLMGENAASRIAQLNILDALFLIIAQRDYQAAEHNFEKTVSAVVSKRKGGPL